MISDILHSSRKSESWKRLLRCVDEVGGIPAALFAVGYGAWGVGVQFYKLMQKQNTSFEHVMFHHIVKQ